MNEVFKKNLENSRGSSSKKVHGGFSPKGVARRNPSEPDIIVRARIDELGQLTRHAFHVGQEMLLRISSNKRRLKKTT